MDQQHNRNALTPALMSGLSRGLETALADEAVGVVVLTNAGPTFCAGADLSGGTPAAAGGGKRRGARRDGLADLLAAIQDSTDRKSTRLNSSHVKISYAVFCLKKKKKSVVKEYTANAQTPDMIR